MVEQVIQKAAQFQHIIYIFMFVGSVISAALFADDRYAHATEFNYHTQEMKRDVKQIAKEVRRQLLEDKIFELDLVPEHQRTQAHRALMNRYKQQLQELIQR